MLFTYFILHVVGVEPWTVFMGHQNEQQGAQNAALGGAGVQGVESTVDFFCFVCLTVFGFQQEF